MIIAIDGPAASGKSTVAKGVAKRMGFIYVDTGAMYRAITWKALNLKIDISDEAALVALTESTKIKLGRPTDGDYTIAADGKDVTEEIRNPKVSAAVSTVSKVAGVRTELVKKQRAFHRGGRDLVLEGRDIGTVVFPDAELKVFLTASVAERARRRHAELVQKGYEVKLETVERDILARDQLDSSRQVSPLLRAVDAITVDTTDKTIDEVIDEIVELAESRSG